MHQAPGEVLKDCQEGERRCVLSSGPHIPAGRGQQSNKYVREVIWFVPRAGKQWGVTKGGTPKVTQEDEKVGGICRAKTLRGRLSCPVWLETVMGRRNGTSYAQ